MSTEDSEVKSPKKQLISDLNTSFTLSLPEYTLSLGESSAFDSSDSSESLSGVQNKMEKNNTTQNNTMKQNYKTAE